MSRYLLISLFLLSACAPPEVIYPSKDLTRVEIFHVEELKQRYDIRLDQASTLYNPAIGGLCLRYTSEELFDLCQARNLLVDLVDSLLEKINTDAYVASQLTTYPLNYENLDLVITFDSFFGEYCDLQYVNQIRMDSGYVTFYAFTAFACEGNLFEIHNEPYETTQANSYYLRKAQEVFAKPEEIAELAPMMTPPEHGLANEPFKETAFAVEAPRPSLDIEASEEEEIVPTDECDGDYYYERCSGGDKNRESSNNYPNYPYSGDTYNYGGPPVYPLPLPAQEENRRQEEIRYEGREQLFYTPPNPPLQG